MLDARLTKLQNRVVVLIFSATSKTKQYRFTHKTRLQLAPVVRIAYILVSPVPLSRRHLEQWRQIGSVFLLCCVYYTSNK